MEDFLNSLTPNGLPWSSWIIPQNPVVLSFYLETLIDPS
jgi:hypothetical protein